MSKFRALVQLQMRGSGINKLLHQSKRKLVAVGIGAILLITVGVSYLLGTAFLLISLNLADHIPGTMVFLSSIVCLVVTFMKGSSLLFGYRDFDTLLSLPVSSRTIVASRVFSLYLLNVFFGFLALMPTMILYCWHIQNFWHLIGSLLLVPFIPLLPLVAGIVLTTVISLIAARFRHQQIAVILISLAGIILLMGSSLFLTKYNSEEMNQLIKQSLEQLGSLYPVIPLIKNGFTGQPFDLLLFVGLSVVVFLLFWVILDRYYLQISGQLIVHTKGSLFKLETFKQKRVLASLLKKEMRLYFSSSLYVLNSIIGIILFLAASLSVPFIMKQVTEFLPKNFEVQQLVPWLPYFPCLFLGISTPASAAISMEGKSSWQYATLPVSAVKIYCAKILLNLLLFLPPIWIGSLSLIYAFPQSWLSGGLLLLLPTCFGLFIVIVSLKFNQLYPNFKWKNEQQVVKQSLPVILTMITGLLSLVLLVSGSLLIKNSTLVVVSESILLFVLSVLAWRSLAKRNVFVE